jgi:hypothetical protein
MIKSLLFVCCFASLVCFSQNVGINTATPHNDALLHVETGGSLTKGFLVTGSYNVSSTIPDLGASSRLMFYPGWAAFRAGRVDGTHWNDANVGFNSVALGYNTTASGPNSTAIGSGTIASGGTSFAVGASTIASGSVSFATGNNTIASSANSMATGSTTRARAFHSFSGGLGTIAKGFASMAVGMFNDSILTVNETAPATGSPIFIIGNGTSDAARSNALVVLNNGHAGIGTSAPERKLHVSNGNYGGGAPQVNSHFILENNTHNYLSVLSPSSSERGIIFGDDLNVNDGGIIYSGASNAMQFKTNGNVTRMTLTNSGNVAIDGNIDIAGTTISFGSAETLADGGGTTITSNSDFVPSLDNLRKLGSSTFRWTEVWAVDGTINTSDAREKENIKTLDYGLKEIIQMRPTRFNWKDRISDGDKIGLLAQDLQKILPEVVRDWEYRINEQNGERVKVPSARMGVIYTDIIPVLIKGVQEQQLQIEELKKENAIQKQRFEIMEEKLRQLEKSANLKR